MDQKFIDQFDGLLEKYTELMIGESSGEHKEKMKMWALYTFISKSMPPLVKHWNKEYPDGKAEMVTIIKEIKMLNEANREKNDTDQEEPGK